MKQLRCKLIDVVQLAPELLRDLCIGLSSKDSHSKDIRFLAGQEPPRSLVTGTGQRVLMKAAMHTAPSHKSLGSPKSSKIALPHSMMVPFKRTQQPHSAQGPPECSDCSSGAVSLTLQEVSQTVIEVLGAIV